MGILSTTRTVDIMAFPEAIRVGNLDEVRRLGRENPARLTYLVRSDFEIDRVVPPLQNAIYHQDIPLIRCLVQALQDAGKDPNVVMEDQDGRDVRRRRNLNIGIPGSTTTLLHVAAHLLSTDTIRYLVAIHGADVDCVDHTLRTPLMECFYNTPRKNTDVVSTVKALLRCGASPYLRTLQEISASDFLAQQIEKYETLGIVKPLEQLRECRALLDFVMVTVRQSVYYASPDGARYLAVRMAMHHRLGAAAPMSVLTDDVVGQSVIFPDGTVQRDPVEDAHRDVVRQHVVDAMRGIDARHPDLPDLLGNMHI